MSSKIKISILAVIIVAVLLPTSAFATYGEAESRKSNWFDHYLISIFYSNNQYDHLQNKTGKINWHDDCWKKKYKWDEDKKDSYKLWKKYYCW